MDSNQPNNQADNQSKQDVISHDQFTKIIDHTDFHHDPPPTEVIPQDENSNPAQETLMGMEYDFDEEADETDEDDEDAMYVSGQSDEEEDENYDENYEENYDEEFEEDLAIERNEDYEGDLSADAKQERSSV